MESLRSAEFGMRNGAWPLNPQSAILSPSIPPLVDVPACMAVALEPDAYPCADAFPVQINETTYPQIAQINADFGRRTAQSVKI